MKSVWCDVGIEQRLTRSSRFETGLLLGQCFDPSRPLLLHSVPTPPEPYSDNRPCWSYETPQWILAHAQQLSRLTVGGLHIVGLYCIDSVDSLRALTAASSSSHQSLCSLLSSLPLPLPSPAYVAPRFFLTSTGSKLSCDYLHPSSSPQQAPSHTGLCLRHAQLKVQELLPSLHCFRCRFHLDFLCAVEGAQGSSKEAQAREGLLSSSVMQLVERTRCLLQAAVAVVDGERLEADATLDSLYGSSSGETKVRKKGRAKGSTSRREEKLQQRKEEQQEDDDAAPAVIHEVELYTPLRLLSPAPSASSSSPSSSLLRLRGCFLCIAYVHSSATLCDAVSALQCDLLSSLSSRLSLLLDETEEEEEWGDPAPTTREMGRRLLLTRPLPLCDYLIEDETLETALERIARLTGTEGLQLQDVMETEAAAVIGEEEARCDAEWKARKAVAERERKQAATAELKVESRAGQSEAAMAEAALSPAMRASALPLGLDANRLLLSAFIFTLVAVTVGFGIQLRYL
jgi:hypothetical protein